MDDFGIQFVKKYAVVFLFLFLTNFGFGQTKEIDTLEIMKIITEAEAIEFSEPRRAIKQYRMAYDISEAQNYYNGAFKASLYLGYVHLNIVQYDSALHYYNTAEKINKIVNSDLNEIKIVLNRANVYMFKGELQTSIENHLHGIRLLEKRNDSVLLCDAYANLSSVYHQLDDFDKQIELLTKSLNFVPLGNGAQFGLTNCDLVLPYLMKEDYEKAYFHMAKADSISNSITDLRLNFAVNRNWGEYYLHQDNFENAIPFYKIALKLAQEYNYSYYEKEINIALGKALLRQGKYVEAETFINTALKLGKKEGLIELSKKALYMLAELHERSKNFEKAYKFMKEHNQLKDSLISKDKVEIINSLDRKYQSVKKDKEIAEQKLAITESNSKTQTMTILIVSLLLGSILLWFSFSQRQKRMQQQLVSIEREQEVRTLESLMEGEEKERLRIAKELHDGVNGDLSAIKFKLISMLETNNQVINEAVAMIDNSCEQVRSISHNLVPPSLRDFDLLEAVENYCNDMNAIHKPEISFQHVGDAIVLEKKQEANVFRIIQELVTNSIKHAEAKELLVQLSNVENNLQLTVEDDGKGFDVDTVKSDGIGMQNIRSRVAYLNGMLDIKSDTKGTSFTISLNDNTKNT